MHAMLHVHTCMYMYLVSGNVQCESYSTARNTYYDHLLKLETLSYNAFTVMCTTSKENMICIEFSDVANVQSSCTYIPSI